MKRICIVPVAIVAMTLAGCGASGVAEPNKPSGNSGPSAEGGKYVLAEEPKGGQDVIEARESVKDGDDVVVVGRIGGDEPWNEAFAAFNIVDTSLKACSDIPGDMCDTPWDYCCERDKLATSSTFVKVVDDEGNVVKGHAKKLLGAKELQTVVVTGKAKRDDAGNLTILAKGVYIRR
jgi:hypothetical protein